MKIERTVNGNKYEFILTDDEVWKAHREFVCAWMSETAETEWDTSGRPLLTSEQYKEIGAIAYDIYCDGDGYTEYESVIEAIERYEKECA